MATHSSTLAWKIPWAEEHGRLQSMGSLRVGHDCATLLSLFTFIHWRRKRQPTPVFLPGESQGRGGAWWAAVYGVAQSWTRLKQLSSNFKSQIKKRVNSTGRHGWPAREGMSRSSQERGGGQGRPIPPSCLSLSCPPFFPLPSLFPLFNTHVQCTCPEDVGRRKLIIKKKRIIPRVQGT